MPKPIEPTEAEQRKEALGATHRAAPRAALIGGTALRIAHGLPRPSSDLDYAHRTSGEDLGKTEIPEILEAMGFKVVATMPDGKIPIRTNVVIRKAGWRNLLGATTTINVDDIRTLEIDEADMVKREGGSGPSISENCSSSSSRRSRTSPGHRAPAHRSDERWSRRLTPRTLLLPMLPVLPECIKL